MMNVNIKISYSVLVFSEGAMEILLELQTSNMHTTYTHREQPASWGRE